jgi:hypothetical protein
VYLSSVSGTTTETRLSLENKATYIPESRARVLWLRCVPIIKGFDHLTLVCTEFESWYNAWRPHMTLEGLRPDDLYYSRKPETPKRDAKTIPGNIERHIFAETRLTGYRLKNAASFLLRGSRALATRRVCQCLE